MNKILTLSFALATIIASAQTPPALHVYHSAQRAIEDTINPIKLVLSSSSSKDIPKEIAQIRNLHTLVLDGSAIANYEGLESESIKSLQLDEVDLSEKDMKLFSRLPNLEKLEFNQPKRMDYKLLFEVLGTDADLQSLTLNDDEMVNLNASISELAELQSLSISGWKIKSFPNNMGQLKHLVSLTIEDAPEFEFDELYGRISSLENLDHLSVRSNAIETVPAGVQEITTLRNLDLSNNNISTFPEDIGKLSHLESLSIVENPVDRESVELLRTVLADCKVKYDIVERPVDKFIKPPVENLNVEYEAYAVDPSIATNLNYESGTRLEIPANAFLDENGEVVKGKVDIAYREFNDPLEIVFSGIPMSYDSAGTKMNFASAGMMEFNATQNGKPVYPNPSGKIRVNLASNNPSEEFDLYYLDERTGLWENTGKDSVSKQDSVINQDIAMNIDLMMAGPVMPQSSVYQQRIYMSFYRKNREKGHFIRANASNVHRYGRFNRAEQNVKTYSDLEVLSRYNWQLDAQDNREAKHYYDSIFDIMSEAAYNNEFSYSFVTRRMVRDTSNDLRKRLGLKPGELVVSNFWLEPNYRTDNFQYMVVIANDTVAIPVIPRLGNNSPESIQRYFNRFYERYQLAFEKRNESWAVVDERYGDYQEAYETAMAQYVAELKDYVENIEEYTQKMRASIGQYEASSYNITRSFALDNFGFWNCDIIKRMDTPKQIVARLYEGDGAPIEYREMFVIDESSNGVLRYPAEQYKKVFDENSRNSMIVILKNNDIGLLTNKEFKDAELNKLASKPSLEILDSEHVSIDYLKKKMGMIN